MKIIESSLNLFLLLICISIVIANPCRNHSCQHGATCIRDGLSTYKCQCPSDYGGDRCEHALPRKNEIVDHMNLLLHTT